MTIDIAKLKTPSLVVIKQVLPLLLILVLAPPGILKALLVLLLSLIMFRPWSYKKLGLFFILGGFFAFNDFMAIKNGVFEFHEPDLLGLPYFEYFIWGYYFYHAQQVIGEAKDIRFNPVALILAFLFNLCFALSSSQEVLLFSSLTIYILSFVVLTNRSGREFSLYFIILGAIIEYTGVMANLWHYPKDYIGGVAYWFVPMWGGIGLLYYNLVGPVWSRWIVQSEVA